jgi:squalene-hopene/tetraprenyl-beta-curcumene cyclase
MNKTTTRRLPVGAAYRVVAALLSGLVLLVGSPATMAQPGAVPDDARVRETHRQRGELLAQRMESYLLSQQDQAAGGWRVNPDGVTFPAITALVLNALLLNPQVDQSDAAIQRSVAYLLGQQQPDGGIYDTVLPSYNTACSISALARVDDDKARAAVERATAFLLTMQWSEDATGPDAEQVGREHPFYGGVGYGGSGRPDASNLTLFLQALEDAGYEHNGPAVQRALVFLSRVQMDDAINEMPYADGSRQGGFIYATSPDSEQLGAGESKAGMIEETLDDGTVVSRLRAYGSMTYAGFKSFAYANLNEQDPRVQAAMAWMSDHYTLVENPGLGGEGFYYFVLVFGRALDAWDKPTLNTADGPRYWAEDLIERLEELQQDDGSMQSINDRWLENDPVLITAYSLIALRHALEE